MSKKKQPDIYGLLKNVSMELLQNYWPKPTSRQHRLASSVGKTTWRISTAILTTLEESAFGLGKLRTK